MAMMEILTIPLVWDFQFDRTMIVPALFIVAAVFMLRSARRRSRQGGTTREEARRQIPSLREQMDVRANLEKLLLDLQELSRQINGHIDTRFCKLEVLLKDADEKIRRLEALNSGAAAPRAAEQEADPVKQMIYKLADAGKSPVEIAREVNKNTGEVELILSLRRSRNGPKKIDYRID
jgi:hypothetical protein